MGESKTIKNVVVVGSDGYIGENLCNYLIDRHMGVFQFDNKNGPEFAAENLNGLGTNMDFVIHLAAFPGIINCTLDFERAVVENISSAFWLFRLSYSQRIPCIFASSQAAKEPYDNLYASIKRIIEVEADRLNRRGADIRIFRLTNVYGGKGYLEKKNTVVKKFIMAQRKNKPLMINGDGSQVRDFTHVNDVCDAIYKCMLRERGFLSPVDIGSGEGVSVLELAKMISEKLTFLPESDTIGISRSVANPKLAKKLFGFEAKHKLSEYLRKEISHV
jgi:nucleoside-diphosphate-sugar epimerase